MNIDALRLDVWYLFQIFSGKVSSYYGSVAKICHREIEKELKTNTGVRICCESSKGGIKSECGSADPEKRIETIGSLCYSHPDTHPSIPFNVFLTKEFMPNSNLPNGKEFRYLYGMPDCPTHDSNLPNYRWSILENGNLKLGNSIYNQTNYCINYGQNMKEGNYRIC